MDNLTDVVFLKQPGDDGVLAVFPFVAATDYLVTCYDHTGQHSGASLWYCDECEEITDPAEYADLMDGLILSGYRLRVISKDCFYSSERITARR